MAVDIIARALAANGITEDELEEILKDYAKKIHQHPHTDITDWDEEIGKLKLTPLYDSVLKIAEGDVTERDLYVPEASITALTGGMTGYEILSWSELPSNSYSSTSKHQLDTLMPVGTSGSVPFWNDGDGKQLECAFHFSSAIVPSVLALNVASGYGYPVCEVFYEQAGELKKLEDITIRGLGETVWYGINASEVEATRWVVKLTPVNDYVGINCIDFINFQYGVVGPQILELLESKVDAAWVESQGYVHTIQVNNTTYRGHIINLGQVVHNIRVKDKIYVPDEAGTLDLSDIPGGDPQDITITETGDGNAITSVYASEHHLTVHKDETFLTSAVIDQKENKIHYILINTQTGTLSTEDLAALTTQPASKIIYQNGYYALTLRDKDNWVYLHTEADGTMNTCIVNITSGEYTCSKENPLEEHINDTKVHLQTGERANWNQKVSASVSEEDETLSLF